MKFNDSLIHEYKIVSQNSTLGDVKCIVETFYDYGNVTNIKQLSSGETNYNYVIDLDKGGIEKRFFAQLYNTNKSLAALKYELGLRNHIMSSGSADLKCALCHNTKDGGYTVACECVDIGRVRYFCLFEYLEGRTLLDREEWAFGRMDDKLIRNMAKGLALFHEKAYGYRPPEGGEGGTSEFAEDLLKYRDIYLNEFPKRRSDPDLDEYYDFFEKYQPRIIELLDRYRKSYVSVKDKLPVCVCHMDPSINNWMFDDDLNVMAVCDLDFSREIMRLFDICLFYIDGFCNPNDYENCLNLDRLIAFIDAYDEAIEQVGHSKLGQITREEREVFPDIFQLVAIKFGFNNIWDVILTNGFSSCNEYNLFWGKWSKACMEFIERNMDELKKKLMK